MSKKILVLNCGSSSIKFELFDMPEEKVYFKGIVEKIGEASPRIKYTAPGNKEHVKDVNLKNHEQSLKLIFEEITKKEHGVLDSVKDIAAFGHRVVHGEEKFSDSVLIGDEVMSVLDDCCKYAPLHNPANIKGIEICKQLLPDVPNVGVFDTAFHQKMPKEAFLYALPYEIYENSKIRRYGFHGTSHKYVSEKGAEILNKPYNSLKIITCHLGNGSSITAIKDGHSIDTSMGHTPLEGLIMGTRCGDMDPQVVTLLAKDEKYPRTLADVDKLLNKQSGLLGISGSSNDMRELMSKMDTDDRAKLAIDMFSYRLKKYISSYAGVLGGVDLLIFTGGIGENSPKIREWSCSDLDFMGIDIDKTKNNEKIGSEHCISTSNSKTKVYVIRTYEELVIARDTMSLT